MAIVPVEHRCPVKEMQGELVKLVALKTLAAVVVPGVLVVMLEASGITGVQEELVELQTLPAVAFTMPEAEVVVLEYLEHVDIQYQEAMVVAVRVANTMQALLVLQPELMDVLIKEVVAVVVGLIKI